MMTNPINLPQDPGNSLNINMLFFNDIEISLLINIPQNLKCETSVFQYLILKAKKLKTKDNHLNLAAGQPIFRF
jgi:hypothetical protein